ncbi:unnamed protein product [Cylicocyclus nassatus]|uniref:Coiled-coil domain-containing protein 53 n=1 Tax=Cylicocyclus nassatus TaxID=53992 RepID=A0AA36MFB0_CYLNA|nr:unnamed protein product [Cylicocyclus nassatus]
MTEPDLSFIKSDIDLSEVAPLNRRRVVAFVNCYLLRMTDHLNAFASEAERMILETERQLHAVDIKLQLLEAKLAAIPDPGAKSGNDLTKGSILEAKNVISSDSSAKPLAPSINQEVVGPSQEKESSSVPDIGSGDPQQPASSEQETSNTQQVLLVKDDPVYAKYFRMLKLGVLEAAVKQKMQSEGFDPALLDTPNAPSPSVNAQEEPSEAAIPAKATAVESDGSDFSSVSSFSDSD